MFDIAIKSNNIITSEGPKNGVVVIRNGKITGIETSIDVNDERVTDFGDLVLMPGVIDPHVHINDPGRAEWEGFDTATRAAIKGGITTLVDMPLNSSPVTTTIDGFNQKIAATHHHLHTNCGFWGGVVPGNENDIPALIEKGVLGFKAFLTHSGIDDFPNVTEADLRKVMPILARHKLPLLVHCELSGNPQGQQNKRSYKEYLASRPKKWEDDAIRLMIRLCEEFNCPTHIVHLSSADSIDQVRRAKERQLPLTVETGQHYLYFNAEEIEEGQTQFKCAPPIREKENNLQLWEALLDGTIDFVATDHSPATPDLKELASGDFTKAWGGIASLQFALPVLWTLAKERNASLSHLAKWLCENPSKLIGLNNNKGKIAIGYDADLIILDSENNFIVKEKDIEHRHKITPYLGRQLYGTIEQTFLSGEKIYAHGNFISLDKGKIITR